MILNCTKSKQPNGPANGRYKHFQNLQMIFIIIPTRPRQRSVEVNGVCNATVSYLSPYEILNGIPDKYKYRVLS